MCITLKAKANVSSCFGFLSCYALSKGSSKNSFGKSYGDLEGVT